MNETNGRNINKLKIIAALVFILLGLIVVVPMTFAWLDVSRVPFVSDMELSVVSENGLLVAPDDNNKPGEWVMYLDVSPYLDLMVPLQPSTWYDGQFNKIVYSTSGRTKGVEPLAPENINVMYPEDIHSPEAEAAKKLGYVVYVDYWLKAEGAASNVYLTSPGETDDGLTNGTWAVGMPIWDAAEGRHSNGAYGSETTLRLGFQIWEADLEGKLKDENNYDFFIYEPNCNIHPDRADGYVETSGVTGAPLVDENHLILQEASEWNEANPISEEVVVYKMGEFVTNPKLFTVSGHNMFKVRMWIWMEGQDADCSALNVVDEAAVLCNIGFGIEDSEYQSEVKRGE